MRVARPGPAVVLAGCLLLAIVSLHGQAHAGKVDEAREHAQTATAAFALGHYTVAAENFEQAFELKPDPALLYNAAQSHRLAGNKERALFLYRNYLHVYGKEASEKRTEAEAHIEELKQAIASETHSAVTAPAASTTAPPETPPETATPALPLPSPTPPSEPAVAPVSIAVQPVPPQEPEPSRKRRLWPWIVAGGLGVAAVAILLVATSGSRDPSASIGKVNGN